MDLQSVAKGSWWFTSTVRVVGLAFFVLAIFLLGMSLSQAQTAHANGTIKAPTNTQFTPPALART